MFFRHKELVDVQVYEIDLKDLQIAYRIAKENGGNLQARMKEIEQELNFVPHAINFTLDESLKVSAVHTDFKKTKLTLLYYIQNADLGEANQDVVRVGLTHSQRQLVLNNLVNEAKRITPAHAQTQRLGRPTCP